MEIFGVVVRVISITTRFCGEIAVNGAFTCNESETELFSRIAVVDGWMDGWMFVSMTLICTCVYMCVCMCMYMLAHIPVVALSSRVINCSSVVVGVAPSSSTGFETKSMDFFNGADEPRRASSIARTHISATSARGKLRHSVSSAPISFSSSFPTTSSRSPPGFGIREQYAYIIDAMNERASERASKRERKRERVAVRKRERIEFSSRTERCSMHELRMDKMHDGSA